MPFQLAPAAIIDQNLQVHLSLAAQLVDVAEKLTLVRADGPAQALIVTENRSKSKWKNGGVMETVCDHPCVVNAGLMIQCFRGVVLTDNDGKVAGRVNKHLVATHAEYRFHRNRLAMAGYFRKCLSFTDAVGIPRHNETLRLRALISAPRW